MSKLDERGGDGGVDVEHNSIPPASPSPPLDAEYDRALRTVREATEEEIQCVRNRQDRTTILRVQAGEPVHNKWSVRTAASFLDLPPDERGQEARDNRDHLVAQIVKTHDRLTAPAPPVEFEREYGETVEEFEERVALVEAEGPPPRDLALVAEHERNCRLHPWITYYLGYRTSPIPEPVSSETPRPVRPPRDRFTLMSCKKARERAGERGQPIAPHWAASLRVMYLDVVAEIGVCPPMVDAEGRRVYTLDRIVNKRGYVPGNVRWADKSQQRDNRDRNPNPQTRASG